MNRSELQHLYPDWFAKLESLCPYLDTDKWITVRTDKETAFKCRPKSCKVAGARRRRKSLVAVFEVVVEAKNEGCKLPGAPLFFERKVTIERPPFRGA